MPERVRPSQGPWVAFLAMCFAVVGLAGLFASYAAPVPYERAFARIAALPTITAQAPAEDIKARDAILAEAKQEAEAVASRIRLLLAVLTLMAGTFGCGVAVIMRRQAAPPLPGTPAQ